MNMRVIAITSLILGIVILVIYSFLLITNDYLFCGDFSLETASKIAPFVGSCVGVFFTLAGTLLVFENLQITRLNNERNQLLTQKNQFENIYFNLLTQQRQIKDGIKTTIRFDKAEIDMESADFNFFDDLILRLKLDFSKKENSKKENSRKELVNLYNKWFTIYNSDLGHFFRHMYHIVKFVDNNPYFKSIDKDENFFQKEDYIKILRAQLSNAEIVLLALNGLTGQGEKFKTYIDKYQLLVNINLEQEMPEDYISGVPGPKIIVDAYPQLAGYM